MKRFYLLGSAAIVSLMMVGVTPAFAHGGGHGGGHGHGGHGHGGHGHAHGGHAHGGHGHGHSHGGHHNGSFAHHHSSNHNHSTSHSYAHNHGGWGHGWGHGWGWGHRGWGWGNGGWGYGGYWGGPGYVDGTTVANPWYYPSYYNQYYDVQDPVGLNQLIERDYVTRPPVVPAAPTGSAAIVDPADQPLDGASDGTSQQDSSTIPVRTASK